ncbi:TIGR02757 family protein [Membranihabitans maritimus]|uniref:TIGR02757 family protein n=1 Tax=Membranihabitans maritimus TaxID=2904244 RepID=UPI001F0211FF|nr:TIGR02757 family protein [Membranihabitans maritimus]
MDHHSARFEEKSFCENDPILIPRKFSRKQDIEIAGFFAAILSWGLRKTIIAKCSQLMEWMDNAPYDFILNHTDIDLKRMEKFKHRTFQPADALYFIHFFHQYYQAHESLEWAFSNQNQEYESVEEGLNSFRQRFFNSEYALERTKKHVPSPLRNSACKRINMFMRWMVRSEKNGVDFGIWSNYSAAQLYIPLDIHVHRVATDLGLLKRKQPDWKAVKELTENLKKFDPEDPVKYDFALFGLGIERKRNKKR